jgi:iduronate 2-sulfatase
MYPRFARGKGKLLGRAIRTERYRLVEWATQDRKFVEHELYDLNEDADENINIARQASSAVIVRQLSEQLAAGWQGALPE